MVWALAWDVEDLVKPLPLPDMEQRFELVSSTPHSRLFGPRESGNDFIAWWLVYKLQIQVTAPVPMTI